MDYCLGEQRACESWGPGRAGFSAIETFSLTYLSQLISLVATNSRCVPQIPRGTPDPYYKVSIDNASR